MHRSAPGRDQALGDRRRGEEHFEAALARCRDIGASTLAARAQIAYAEALLGSGDAAATRKAVDLLADAATELGP